MTSILLQFLLILRKLLLLYFATFSLTRLFFPQALCKFVLVSPKQEAQMDRDVVGHDHFIDNESGHD